MCSINASTAAPMKRGIKLAAKLNLLSASLILLTAAVLAGYAIFQKSETAHEDLAVRGMEIAKIAALNSQYGIYTESGEELQQIVNNLLVNRNVVAAEMRDSKHKLLMQTSNAEEQAMPDYVAQRPSTQQEVSVSVFNNSANKTRYSVITVPVLGSFGAVDSDDESGAERHVIGYIRISLSHASLQQSVNSFALSIMSVTLLAVLVGVVLTLLMTRRITSPLLAVVKATRRVARGNFDQRVAVTTGDEVAWLANNFNEMAYNLKTYKREVDEHRAGLEQKVAQRTAELSEKNHKLKHAVEQAEQARIAAEAAQLAAEQASKAKGEFLATMSHEIRTPLNGVLGMADILARTELDASQQRFLNVITQSGETLLELISEILDFSKIEAGKLELNYSSFNMRQFVEDLGLAFAGLAHRKNIDIACYLPPQYSLLVEGDVARLRQILSNLIGNAIKFTQHGLVELRVDVLQRLADGTANIRFEVRDTGIGIHEKKLQHIFDSFTQADSSTTRDFGGTGLGLAIGKHLIEMMGGEINVSSTLGEGSSFWFEICLPVQNVNESEVLDIAERFQGLRALIVDDLATNREIIEHQLTTWGMFCRQVASGAECLEELNRTRRVGKPYDLMILDYHMPGMDGMELARRIKADAALNQIRMVMLSSVSDIESQQHMREVGIVSRLLKPVRQADLFDTLVALFFDQDPDAVNLNGKTVSDVEVPKIVARVLLAEDTIVNQEVATIMLESIGCNVTLAENGCEALTACQQGGHDLVLMDCQMPEMDGYQATAAIREFEQSQAVDKSIPIIALTANAVDGDREKCLAAGMDDYLSKPFTLADLASMLAKWLPTQVVDPAASDSATNTPDSNQAACANTQTAVVKTLAPAATQTTAANDEPLLDATVLEQFQALGKASGSNVVLRIVNSYLKETPQHVQTMVAANDDAEQLYKAAHALKSSSFNVGAKRLALLCQQLEALGRNGSCSGVNAMLVELQQIYKDTTQVLQREYTGT